MGQKWSHRPTAKLLSHISKPAANQDIPADSSREDVRHRRPISRHASLVFKSFEELLHRRIMSRAATRIDPVGQLSNGGRTTVPERLEHSEFGIANVRNLPHDIVSDS